MAVTEKTLANLKRGGGRPPGTKNKTTRTLKMVIEKTFDKLGGTQGLVKWAEESAQNRAAFYTIIWPKLIPKNIDLQANITHDIAERLLQARSIQSNIQGQIEQSKLIEIDSKGKIVTDAIIKESVAELEREEAEEDGEMSFSQSGT